MEKEIQYPTENRKNRFSGESIKLTKDEAIIYDNILIDEAIATLEDKKHGFGTGASKYWDKVRKGLNYFRKNNANAYMVLLD